MVTSPEAWPLSRSQNVTHTSFVRSPNRTAMEVGARFASWRAPVIGGFQSMTVSKIMERIGCVLPGIEQLVNRIVTLVSFPETRH